MRRDRLDPKALTCAMALAACLCGCLGSAPTDSAAQGVDAKAGDGSAQGPDDASLDSATSSSPDATRAGADADANGDGTLKEAGVFTDGQAMPEAASADAQVDGAVNQGPDGGPPIDASPDGNEYGAPMESLVNDTTVAGRTHTDPDIALSPSTIYTVFEDSDGPGSQVEGWAKAPVSSLSFADQGAFPDAPDGGVREGYFPRIACDTANGNVYVVTGATLNGYLGALAFFISTNAGASFAPPVNATDPMINLADWAHRPAIAVDNGSGPNHGFVYIAYGSLNTTGLLRVTTYSGALSTYVGGPYWYAVAVNPASMDGAWQPSVAVAPNHYVYVAYFTKVGTSLSIGVVRSRDNGKTFDPPVTAAPIHLTVGPTYDNSVLTLDSEGVDGGATTFRVYTGPELAINPVSGALYVTYTDATQGSDKADVFFVHSEDGAMTWSSPVRVNDDSTTNDQFVPAVAVSPDGLRLAIDFYDRRDDPANLAVARYGAVASVSGGSVVFAPNFRISASYPLLVSTDTLYSGIFDIYTAMAADATYFYDVYADSRDGALNVRLARYGRLFQ